MWKSNRIKNTAMLVGILAMTSACGKLASQKVDLATKSIFGANTADPRSNLDPNTSRPTSNNPTGGTTPGQGPVQTSAPAPQASKPMVEVPIFRIYSNDAPGYGMTSGYLSSTNAIGFKVFAIKSQKVQEDAPAQQEPGDQPIFNGTRDVSRLVAAEKITYSYIEQTLPEQDYEANFKKLTQSRKVSFDPKGLPAGEYFFIICAKEKMKSEECGLKNYNLMEAVHFGRDVLGPWLWHTALNGNYIPLAELPTFTVSASGVTTKNMTSKITTSVWGHDRMAHNLTYSGFPMLIAKGAITYGGMSTSTPVCTSDDPTGCAPVPAKCSPNDPNCICPLEQPECLCSIEDPNCDQQSPLIIDLGNEVAKASVLLSSREQGVLFDIENNGSKKRISWPLNPEKDLFLALPLNGQILSSEQLFGNQTNGKDGKKAANGFLALSEYASADHPEVIDSRDSIYAELRLWSDLNRDGIAQANELHTLAEKGVKSIRLDYVEMDATDIYGNSTRQRSFVEMLDATKRMIFDVWFKIE